MPLGTKGRSLGFRRKVTYQVAAVATDLLEASNSRLPSQVNICLPSTPNSPTGKRLGFTIDSGKFHNVSLGQGQEVVAEMALEKAATGGHWVILQVSVKFSGGTPGRQPIGRALLCCPAQQSRTPLFKPRVICRPSTPSQCLSIRKG